MQNSQSKWMNREQRFISSYHKLTEVMFDKWFSSFVEFHIMCIDRLLIGQSFFLWHDYYWSSNFQDPFILSMCCFFNVINFILRENFLNFCHLSFLLNKVIRNIEMRGSITVSVYTVSGYLTLHSVAKKIYQLQRFYIFDNDLVPCN